MARASFAVKPENRKRQRKAKGDVKVVGRQLTITVYYSLIFGNVSEWERADAITGRNVAVAQK
jgi:hypothetical protein